MFVAMLVGLRTISALQALAALRLCMLANATMFVFMFPMTSGLAEEDKRTPALLAFGAGYYDFAKRSDTAVDLRVEYRSGLDRRKFRPWLGLEVTTDGAVYGVGGLLVDLELDPHWILTPNAGVGAYFDGGGKELGSKLEFRLQAELAYRFEDESRLALAFSHISNARIGGNNPGTEILTLYYMIPLERIFGKSLLP